LAAKVGEQIVIMRDQVTRHLERARIAARATVVGSVTEVAPVVTALTRTMEKIYHPRGIAIDLDAPEGVRFRGERQDIEEMLGNLVDNACKWAQARVSIEVTQERQQDDPLKTIVRVVVDDDGPGLSPADRDQVARRGSASTRPSRLRARPVDRAGARLALRRQPYAVDRADRRPARRAGAAGGVRGRRPRCDSAGAGLNMTLVRFLRNA